MMRPILANSCARAITAAEARFRIDAPVAGRRGARVVALDDDANRIVARLAGEQWSGARFFTLASPVPEVNENGSAAVVLAAPDGSASGLGDELADADVVVMIAAADGDRNAAAAIGNACTVRGIMTAGLILGEQVGAAVDALRPYARVLMVTTDEHDVAEVLTALRA